MLASAPAAGVIDLGGSARPASAVNAGAITNDYPYSGATGGVDPWNFYKGQCTSFAAWRINSRLGVSFTNQYGGQTFGNANHWDDAARAAGLTVSSVPQPGAIAQSDAGTYGHVAWVARVNSDDTVTIEEYNWGTPYTYGVRTVAASNFEYIYFGAVGRDGTIRDVNRDGRSDLVGVHSSGALYRYTGNGDGSLDPGVSVGTGWGNFRLASLADVNGDDIADVIGVHTSGSLYRYLGRGDGTFRAGAIIWSGGWGNFRTITSSDLNNDGYADLLAVHIDGSLYRYVGRSDGTFDSWGGAVGGGWKPFRLVTSGDVNGDGRADLVAVRTDGSLYRWSGYGNGTFASAVKIWDGGWGNFRLLNSADYNNDGRTDLFAVHNDGSLYRYAGKADGTVASWGGKVGSGWGNFTIINN